VGSDGTRDTRRGRTATAAATAAAGPFHTHGGAPVRPWR
jgi:hypothetical protein